jgi:hypothetical protein
VIINELLDSEELTRNLEFAAETTRTNLYLEASGRIHSSIEDNETRLLNLQGDLYTSSTRLREL